MVSLHEISGAISFLSNKLPVQIYVHSAPTIVPARDHVPHPQRIARDVVEVVVCFARNSLFDAPILGIVGVGGGRATVDADKPIFGIVLIRVVSVTWRSLISWSQPRGNANPAASAQTVPPSMLRICSAKRSSKTSRQRDARD